MAQVEVEAVLALGVAEDEVRPCGPVEEGLETLDLAVDLGVVELQGRNHVGRKARHRRRPHRVLPGRHLERSGGAELRHRHQHRVGVEDLRHRDGGGGLEVGGSGGDGAAPMDPAAVGEVSVVGVDVGVEEEVRVVADGCGLRLEEARPLRRDPASGGPSGVVRDSRVGEVDHGSQ